MGRPHKHVILRAEDKLELEKLVKKGKHSAREINHAWILLKNHGLNGKNAAEIAEELSICKQTVHNVVSRYEKGGLALALKDLPRSGAPSKLTPAIEAASTAIACSKPPEGSSSWTLNLIGEKLVELKYVESISKSSVCKLLKKAN